MDITIKKGDTRSGIEAQLIKNGTPIDLSGCTVLFYMQKKVEGIQAKVLDVLGGKVLFPLELSNVNESGIFKSEFKVIYPDGRKETFPNDGFINIYINDSLEAE